MFLIKELDRLVGVVMHGLTLKEYVIKRDKWEYVVWGDSSQDLMGRLPKAVEVALAEGAYCLIVGTGATKLDGVRLRLILIFAIYGIISMTFLIFQFSKV